MVQKHGLWPGVIAVAMDADIYCIACATPYLGAAAMNLVIHGGPGSDQVVDHEGNPVGVLLYGTQDAHGQYCGSCHCLLCDDDCACYRRR